MKNPIDELISSSKSMDLSIPYYDDNSRISNSSIGWFFISPAYFKRMLDGEGVKFEAKFLSKGSRIHMYLLQPNEFWKEYRISSVAEPSSKNQKEFASTYIAALNSDLAHSTACIEAYKTSYSTKGQADTKIAENGLKMAEELKEYIEELQSDDKREKMIFADLADLKDIAKNVENHILANKYVYPKGNLEVHSEFHINWIHEPTGLECKSLIDRLIIDHENKKISLVDLKTTNKIHNFEASMLEYGYYRQMAFYWKAIEWYFKNILEIDINTYSRETVIVGISTNELTKNEIRVFSISEDKMATFDDLLDDALEEISWHFDNNKFEHTKDYYTIGGLDFTNNKWNIQESDLQI